MANNTNLTAINAAIPAPISKALSTIESIELSPVNKSILATVPENLQNVTSAIMRANQFSSGVSLALCELLYNLKSNCSTELKTSKWKNYSNYCKDVLRLDPSQSSNYAMMYERLFYDVDKPITKFVTDGYTVAQLVAIAKLKDRTIRNMFIEIVSADYSCTNINKAVAYLRDFNKQSLELNIIDWNIVKDLLANGKSEKLEKEEKTEKATETATETATDPDNICKFTNIAEFKKWYENNKKTEIINIVVTIKK